MVETERMIVLILCSLIMVVSPLNQQNCSEQSAGPYLTECLTTVQTFFENLKSAGIELDSAEGIARLCDPSDVYKHGCFFWILRKCPDLDFSMFIQIQEVVLLHGFDLPMAFADGGLESNCDIIGPCYEVSQCYKFENVDKAVTTPVQSNTDATLQSNEEKVVPDRDKSNEPSTTWDYFDMLGLNSSTPWWFSSSTELPWSTVDGNTHNDGSENSTTAMPFNDGNIVHNIDGENNGNRTMRGDTSDNDGMIEDVPKEHVPSVRDTPMREDIPIENFPGVRDTPLREEDMPLGDSIQRSIYMTTPISNENKDKKSQFLSLTLTLCRKPSNKWSCKVSSLKKCSASSSTRIERKLLEALNIFGIQDSAIPNPENFDFEETECSSSFQQSSQKSTCLKSIFVPVGSLECKKDDPINISPNPYCNINELSKMFLWDFVEPNCGNKFATFLAKDMCLTFPGLPEECSEKNNSGINWKETFIDISGSDVIELSFGIAIFAFLMLFYLF